MNSYVPALVSIFISANVSASAWAANPNNASPRHFYELSSGSRITVDLSYAELAADNQKRWRTEDQGVIRQCQLRIRSHYDHDHAKSLGHADYKIVSVLENEAVNVKGLSTDSVSFELTVEDPGLPLLNFSCQLWSPARDASLTTHDVEFLISKPGFFARAPSNSINAQSAAGFYPAAQFAKILKPLHFSGKENPQTPGSIFTNRSIVRDGAISETNADLNSSYCTMNFDDRKTELKPYDIAIPPADYPISFLTATQQIDDRHTDVTYIFTFETTPGRISVECRPSLRKPNAPFNFEEVAAHLRGIIELH